MNAQLSRPSRVSDRPGKAPYARRGKGVAVWPMVHRGILLLVVVAMVGFAGESAADKVYRKDGTVITGCIISEDADLVIMALGEGGTGSVVSIPTEKIEKIVRADIPQEQTPQLPLTSTSTSAPAEGELLEGVWYYPIPIKGEIGLEVKAKTLKLALDDAREHKPNYVVLCIDSVGGSVAETRKIVEVLAEAQDLRMVAYVEQALSAAAVISLTCPDIYMKSSAVMGGAVPYRMGPKGTPQAVEEKFESVIRAQFRAAAEMGGHSPLLVEAMMDTEIQLLLLVKDGEKTLATEGEGELLKPKGKVLAMTASEAMECGLVKGTARNLESLSEAMDIDTWNRVEGKGWGLMMAQAALARRELEEEQKSQELAAQPREPSPKLKQIDGKIAKVRIDIRLANAEMSLLKGQYDREVAAAMANYRRDRKHAITLGVMKKNTERERLLRAAKSKRDNKLNSIRRQFEPRVMSLKLKLRRFNENLVQLIGERQMIIYESRLKSK